METVKIVLVDDKEFNLQILQEKLSPKPELQILFTAKNGVDFIDQLKHAATLPDLVFMDIDMPEMNGIEAVFLAKKQFPEIHFVMITVFEDDEKVFQAIQAGASGYLLKDESVANLHRAINELIQYGGAPMSPQIARKAFLFIQQQGAAAETKVAEETPLSSREMDILKGLVDGKSYITIANTLFISPHTVRKHMTNIYDKLHVHSKVEAVTMAIYKGWFDAK
jgi:DNA-binding NarL/FixJ family response regulator